MSRLIALGLVAASLALCAAAGSPPSRLHESSIGGTLSDAGTGGEVGRGRLVFAKWCAGCHAAGYKPTSRTLDGDRLPITSRLPLGTNLLGQRYQGSVPAALEERTDLTGESIALFVRRGINAMPGFRKTELSDADLKALSAYLTRTQR